MKVIASGVVQLRNRRLVLSGGHLLEVLNGMCSISIEIPSSLGQPFNVYMLRRHSEEGTFVVY